MRILLIVYDNGSYIHWFPQGLAYIASVLVKKGYHVEIYNQDMHHYPDAHLTGYLNQNNFDVVCLSFIAGYYQYRKALSISNAINQSKRKPFYIIGGHGPSPEPDFFLNKTHADAVVIGEGEETILELLEAVEKNHTFESIKGIAYKSEHSTIINPRRELLKDVDSIPFPAYNLFPVHYYRLIRMPHCSNSDFIMPVLSGRGCTFECTFCYRMDKGFRPRSNESIIEEIKYLVKDYNITYIVFSDELLMSSEDRVTSLCIDFIKSNLNIKWECNGRLNYAKPDILKLMKESGCVFINYGIEAVDDNVLRLMKKGLTVKQIIKGIEATLNANISPGYNVIFGNIGDSEATIKNAVDFLVKYDDGAQMRTIRPVTPYPGSPLYYNAIRLGLLKDCEDFYENKHVNSDLLSVNFTDMTEDKFYDVLSSANLALLENYFVKRKVLIQNQLNTLYVSRDETFRGFRQT